MHTEQNIADLLREGLRPLDRAVRLGPGEFLVVQPAVGPDELTDRSLRLERRLAALHATYPFVDLHPRTTTMLTAAAAPAAHAAKPADARSRRRRCGPRARRLLPIEPRGPAVRGAAGSAEAPRPTDGAGS